MSTLVGRLALLALAFGRVTAGSAGEKFLGTTSKPACDGKPYPLIFDNDADYDDILGFLYIAHSPNFEFKAITIESDGFGTPHGGPTNMAAVAQLVGMGNVPIAFGQQRSLSPIATMPLQWRMQVDELFERMYPGGPNGTVLNMTDRAISALPAPQLIIKVLKESVCPVVILCTGPQTNLAVAMDMDPSIVTNIHSVYMMGSAYGVPGTNNVFDWQMTWNGVKGSCGEDGGQTYTGLSTPIDLTGDGAGDSLVRPGCRGINMTIHGDTEWNVFMDVLAWRKVSSYLKESNAAVYVLAANATLSMPVTLPEMENNAATLHDEHLRIFVEELAKNFLQAGEAKWWDAQCAVMMDEILSGRPEGVCSHYARGKRTSVSLVWRSRLQKGELNPYGSVKDDAYADAPAIDYCLRGNVTRMQEVYWRMINRTSRLQV